MADITEIQEHYADLLIMQYHSQYKARETVKTGVNIYTGDGVLLDLQDVLDIDVAVGKQLDIIGKILDCPRIIPGLTTDVEFFSFEKENALGFSTVGNPSRGYFKDITLDYRSTYSLLDDEYRKLLKFKAVANRARASWKDLDDLFYNVFNIGKVFNKSAFTKIGNPSITEDGIASGFNYFSACLFTTFNPSNYTWKIKVKVKPTSVSESWNAIFGGDTGYNKPHFYFVGDKLGIFLSSDGLSWNIAEGLTGTHTYSANTDYYLIFEYTGTQYIVSYSTDGKNYTQDIVVNNSASIYNGTNETLLIGAMFDGVWFHGSIDLSHFSIIVDGKEVFSGLKEQSAIEIVNNKDLSITYNVKQKYLDNTIRACIMLGYFEPPLGIGYNINYI